jgi:transcription antitermination factor NusG
MAAPRDMGAIGSGGAFQGFADADFNAYEQKKQSSNAYTLERRKAKDKLLALTRAVQEELEDELKGLELGASDEAPTVANARKVEAQWIFFTRNADDRTSIRKLLQKTDLHEGAGLFDIAIQHQHACLIMRLDQRGLAVGVELATKAKVDRENTSEKLKQGWAREKLVEIARGLPNGAEISFAGGRADPTEIKAAELESWIAPLAEDKSPFVAEALLPRAEEILKSTALIGTINEHVAAFLPLYRFMAWARDNEHRPVKEAIKKQIAAEQEQKQKRAAFEPGDRVTILSGLFAGRSGYLAEVDAKGRAKVMVGPVSVTVDAKDLKAS